LALLAVATYPAYLFIKKRKAAASASAEAENQ
jgi:hypothetical protein